jgi:hypothetical protein
MLWKLDLFLFSGEVWETPTLLGTLQRANLKRLVRLLILEYQTMDKEQNPRNHERYTTPSEPFRIYQFSVNLTHE